MAEEGIDAYYVPTSDFHDSEYVEPYFGCRQFLSEFSTDMEVLCAKAGGRYVSYRLRELMPHTFNY